MSEKIEFFDREKEKKEIMNILKAEPLLINFIYGPINSGKTALIMNLIENLPKDYVVFYINLRGKFISNYKDFVEALFEIFKENEPKNVFEYITKVMQEAKESNKKPILIIDELQVIKDIEVDGK
ncbi:MAG: ATP-binding protein, partial [Candidatus Altarchaeaceae archaeon]